MIVCAVIVLILSFTVPAISGLSKANNLTSAGRVVSNLLTVARSEAINRRTLIRFHVATEWPDDSSYAYRKITLAQHNGAAGTDTQLTNWETLPAGITFAPNDPGGNSGRYFFDPNHAQAPTLTFAGHDVATVYIEFLPTGALNIPLQDSPMRMRLVAGYVNADSLTNTAPNNWLDTTVDALVGRIATNRP